MVAVAAASSLPVSSWLPKRLLRFATHSPEFFQKTFSPEARPFLDLAKLSLEKGKPSFALAPLFAKKAVLNSVLGRGLGIAAAAGLGSGLTWLVHQVPNMHNWSGPVDALVKAFVPAVLFGGIVAGLDNDTTINSVEEKEYRTRRVAIVGSAFVSSVLGAWLHATGKHSDPFDVSFVAAASVIGLSMLVGPFMRYVGVKEAIREFGDRFVSDPHAEANIRQVLADNPELNGEV